MFFSIIIPIYNVEPYLRRAVDSALHQDFTGDYEIVLIDDGSTDNSGKICDEYATAHENIRVIHKQNGGQAVARNMGLDIVIGKYIIFLDSDDWIDVTALSNLFVVLEKNPVDILGFSYQTWDNEKKTEIIKIDYAGNKTITISDVLNEVYFLPSVCLYAFKHDFLDTNKLRFVSGIYHEDEEFIARAVCLAQTGHFRNIPLYNYFQHIGSTMTNKNIRHQKKRIEDSCIIIQELERFQKNFAEGTPQWNYIKKQLLIINYRIFRNLLDATFDFSWSYSIYCKQKCRNYIPLRSGISEIHYSLYQNLTKIHLPFWILRLFYKIVRSTHSLRKACA